MCFCCWCFPAAVCVLQNTVGLFVREFMALLFIKCDAYLQIYYLGCQILIKS
jgi:hypothetical protein